jgi:AraC family transcriptional regulator of adaptative response/methylated-DNA-[protein]-cysteine methyltransferase
MDRYRQAATDYARIERAIRFIAANFRRQPDLDDVARAVGLSPYHCQRLFRRWAGVSPKRFLQYLTAAHAGTLLRDSQNLLDAAYASGLSGTGRLHDLMVNVHAVTPGEMQRRGDGVTIRYGVHPTPFGDCFIALTPRGVCALDFLPRGTSNAALADLRRRWPRARFEHDADVTQTIARRIFRRGTRSRLDVHLEGTNFQIKVWEALLRIPPGAVASYADVARAVGRPRAVRAAASAVADNPVGFLIPCHRVIRSTGALGEYHWGVARKQALLAWEAATTRAQPPDGKPDSPMGPTTARMQEVEQRREQLPRPGPRAKDGAVADSN